MSDNPIETTPEREARIRHRAYLLWEEDGRPDGREQEFWARAEELIGMEESAGAGLLSNPMTRNEPIPGVIVEEASIQENYGEIPARLTDQGEWREVPMSREKQREYEEGKLQPTRGDAP